MKKLILKSLFFLILIWSLDFAIGSLLEKMYFSIETGTSGALINHMLHNEYDVYILGSSSAQHGYIPDIISKKLDLSTYNAGEDGTGVLYTYSILQILLRGEKPKIIIWDVTYLDWYYKEVAVKANLLLPYYGIGKIGQLLDDLNPLYKVLRYSHLYTYNHKLAAVLTEYIKSTDPNTYTESGYIPIRGSIDLSLIESEKDEEEIEINSAVQPQRYSFREEDELIRIYLRKFIYECKINNIKLIAFDSPRCPIDAKAASTDQIPADLEYTLTSNGVDLYKILPSEYEELNRIELFKDLGHMNSDGAAVYSKIIADILFDQLDKESTR